MSPFIDISHGKRYESAIAVIKPEHQPIVAVADMARCGDCWGAAEYSLIVKDWDNEVVYVCHECYTVEYLLDGMEFTVKETFPAPQRECYKYWTRMRWNINNNWKQASHYNHLFEYSVALSPDGSTINSLRFRCVVCGFFAASGTKKKIV